MEGLTILALATFIILGILGIFLLDDTRIIKEKLDRILELLEKGGRDPE